MSKKSEEDSFRNQTPNRQPISFRTWILTGISFVAWLFSVLLARIVTFPAASASKQALFIYQAISGALNWIFVITAAAALFTFLNTFDQQDIVDKLYAKFSRSNREE